MDLNNKVLLTREGLTELKREYNTLMNVKRPDAVQRLSDARDLGDLSENSEYAAAKQDLTFIDGRILELEEIIHGAKLISGTHTKSLVDLGCKVILHVDGKKEEFMLVGEWEADPNEKKISHESPLGKALMGKKVGDKVEVEAPVGKLTYKILGIE